MPWDRTTRKLYNRSNDCRQNDLTDDGRAIAGPMPPKRGKMGRPRMTGLRSVFDGIRYILSTGCQWRALPTEYPPYSTDRNHFHVWCRSGPPGMSRLPAGPRPTARGAFAGAGRRRHRQPVGEGDRKRRTPRLRRGREGEGPEADRRGGRRGNAGCHREAAGDGPERALTPGRRRPPRPEAARTP